MADGKTLYVLLTANATAYKAALRDASRDTRKFGDDVDDMGKKLDRSGHEIDKMSGRFRIIADALTLLGPASIPILGITIPAITGLASMLGVTAIAGGSAMLAFRGLGDVLTSMKTASLAPTTANLTKLHEKLVALPPDTRAFVEELRSLGPVLDTLQGAAAHGLFPGLTAGLEDLRSMTGPLANLLEEASSALGNMANEYAHAFDSARGREFVRFLTAEVRPGVEDLLRTVGNLAGGMAEMWMAFAPTNHAFGDWLVEVSQDFDTWASKLDGTQGFQDFLAYLDETGPKVADAMGSLGNMLVQIVEAAAPLGGPVLEGIAGVADAISAIADSPLGPVLFTAAAAATLLNRGLQLTSALLGKIGLQAGATAAAGVAGGAAAGSTRAMSTGVASQLGQIQTRASGARATFQGLRSDIANMSTQYARAATTVTTANKPLFGPNPLGAASSYRAITTNTKAVGAFGSVARSALSGTSGAAGRTTAALGTMTRGFAGAGVGIGAMALLTTGAGESLGVTNTAMLTMVGSMAGPWGAALGFGVGAMIDFSKAGDDVRDTLKNVDEALASSSATFASYNAAVQQGQSTTSNVVETSGNRSALGQLGHSLTPSGVKENLDVLIGGADTSFLGQAADDYDRLTMAQDDMVLAANALAKATGVVGTKTANSAITQEDWTQALTHAQPAMDALGISVGDLTAGVADGSIVGMIDQIGKFQRQADSADGKTHAFADSVAQLGMDALSTADSAGVMASALDSLLSPTLTAEEATDKWRQSLRALGKDLKANAGFKGYGKEVEANRALTRQYVADSQSRLTALAGLSTTTEKDMALAVAETRKEFIKSGMAAGFSRDQITRRANALGLTPKLIKTVFQAANIDKATLQARKLKEAYRSLPKNVRTDLKANGIPSTAAAVDRLVKKYHLSEKDRVALLSVKDLASKDMEAVLAQLHIIDRTSVAAAVKAETGSAQAAISGVLRSLFNLDGQTATTYVRTVHTGGPGPQANANGGIYHNGLRTFADGGYGANGRYYSRDSQIVKGGASILWGEQSTGFEAYISGKPSQRERNVKILSSTAERFGMTLSKPGAAANGRYGSELVNTGGSGGQTVVVRSAMPSKVDLVVDGRTFTAYVRGHAEDVVKKKIEAVNDADVSTNRRDW